MAVPFYSQEDYVAIVRLIPDGDWTAAYEECVAKIERGFKIVAAADNVPGRVDVVPSAFEAWCHRHKHPVSQDSISKYCIYVLATLVIKSGGN